MAKCTRCGRSVMRVNEAGLCSYCAPIESGEVEARQAEKEQAKAEALLRKYHLEDVHNSADLASLRTISANLCANGLFHFADLLDSRATPADHLQTVYQRSILEQNWIIIRQLDKLINK